MIPTEIPYNAALKVGHASSLPGSDRQDDCPTLDAWCGRADADAAGREAPGADEMSGCPGGRDGLGESVGRAGAVCGCA